MPATDRWIVAYNSGSELGAGQLTPVTLSTHTTRNRGGGGDSGGNGGDSGGDSGGSGDSGCNGEKGGDDGGEQYDLGPEDDLGRHCE